MTQRTRLMLVDVETERRRAEESCAAMLARHADALLGPEHPLAREAQGILDALVNVVGAGAAREWTLRVVQEEGVANACVLADGSVWIFTGLLRSLYQMENPHLSMEEADKAFQAWIQHDLAAQSSCTNVQAPGVIFSDTLAAVLAHEIAHVLSRHSAEDYGLSQLFQVLSDAFHGLLYTVSLNLPLLSDVAGRGVDAVAPYLSTLPYSRLMEMEADVVGLFLMAVAGYNPGRAIELWKYLAMQQHQQKGAAFLEFTSSHPSHERRASELMKHYGAAMEIYHAHKRIEDALRMHLKRKLEISKKR
ncbi:peptidase family M48-domain-containing protein [Chytriomyces sp. MP71]|nr:peptidase family M48-domain-containing protein [Chytriomyces sp. MP71]